MISLCPGDLATAPGRDSPGGRLPAQVFGVGRRYQNMIKFCGSTVSPWPSPPAGEAFAGARPPGRRRCASVAALLLLPLQVGCATTELWKWATPAEESALYAGAVGVRSAADGSGEVYFGTRNADGFPDGAHVLAVPVGWRELPSVTGADGRPALGSLLQLERAEGFPRDLARLPALSAVESLDKCPGRGMPLAHDHRRITDPATGEVSYREAIYGARSGGDSWVLLFAVEFERARPATWARKLAAAAATPVTVSLDVATLPFTAVYVLLWSGATSG